MTKGEAMAIATEIRKKVNFGKPKSFEDVIKKRGAVFLKKHRHPGPKFFLALNVLELRKKKGWTQLETAERADVAFNTYVNIEQAQPTVNPTADNLIKLSEAFGVTISELWKERKFDF